MQANGLDSWTWSGGTAAPLWVPNPAPGLWMWLIVASVIASLLGLLLILIVDRSEAIGTDGEPLLDRSIGTLTPREIVSVLTGLRTAQRMPGPPDSSAAIANRLRAELRRWECHL